MIMNLSNFYFDGVSIFTHFTKHWICMYERLIIAYILNNAMHAYNFFQCKPYHNSSFFFFISEARKGQEGKLFVIYDNES